MPFPLDEIYLQEAETQLGVRFPDSYRQVIMASNGGEIEIDEDFAFFIFPIADKSEPKRIARTMNHVVANTQKLIKDDIGFPADGIAIAEDQSGNYLVMLKTDGALQPEIYVWYHEEPDDLELIADDFGEFVE
jgi:hypothetical protein